MTRSPPKPSPVSSVRLGASNRPRVPIDLIRMTVANRYGITLQELTGPCRKRVYARPRQIAIYLARLLTPLSLPALGHRFGGRDHSTMLHAYRRVFELVDRSPAEELELNALERELLECAAASTDLTRSTSSRERRDR